MTNWPTCPCGRPVTRSDGSITKHGVVWHARCRVARETCVDCRARPPAVGSLLRCQACDERRGREEWPVDARLPRDTRWREER
jgi:hypothetical protein